MDAYRRSPMERPHVRTWFARSRVLTVAPALGSNRPKYHLLACAPTAARTKIARHCATLTLAPVNFQSFHMRLPADTRRTSVWSVQIDIGRPKTWLLAGSGYARGWCCPYRVDDVVTETFQRGLVDGPPAWWALLVRTLDSVSRGLACTSPQSPVLSDTQDTLGLRSLGRRWLMADGPRGAEHPPGCSSLGLLSSRAASASHRQL